MISYGWWIHILRTVLFFLTLFVYSPPVHAVDIAFYRSIETPYESGRSDIKSLSRTTLSKKSQNWVQVEWEPEFGTLQQGWVRSEELQPIQQHWQLTTAKKTLLQSLPMQHSLILTSLEKFTPVRIIGEHQTIWSLSFQKSHGFVWWVDTDELKAYQAPIINKNTSLSTADIFKRKLFDLAANPNDENLQVASSQGIYISRDGKLWEPILKFKNSDLPIAFSTKGTLFVGQYRSLDEGRTFEPVLKWDKIASQVINATRKSPSQLRILEIESQSESVIMTISVGRKQNIKLVSKDDGSNWEVLRTTPPSLGELHL